MHIKTIANRNDIHSHCFQGKIKNLPKFREEKLMMGHNRYGEVMNYFGILNSLLINKH